MFRVYFVSETAHVELTKWMSVSPWVEAAPRLTLEQTMSAPRHKLGCACCPVEGGPSSTLPDTCAAGAYTRPSQLNLSHFRHNIHPTYPLIPPNTP